VIIFTAAAPSAVSKTDQNVSGSELTVVGLAAVGRLLIMDADHNRAIAEDPHRGIAPIERRCDEDAAAIAL
jgi:hypothetical protein